MSLREKINFTLLSLRHIRTLKINTKTKVIMKFKALIVKEVNGKFIREISTKSIDELPGGDVLIKVKYSSLNYKDALIRNRQ